MSDWVDVVKESECPPGSWATVDIDDVLIAVFNLNGSFYAIEDICTHDGDTLTGGEVRGKEIICPRHGARFDITTGEVLAEPAYEDLPTFPVRIENGVIQVKDDRWD